MELIALLPLLVFGFDAVATTKKKNKMNCIVLLCNMNFSVSAIA